MKNNPPYEKNPRYANGALRRKYRQRFQVMNAPCGICGGLLGEIRYDEPSDSKHDLSFVIDEIHPISKWKQYGYSSAREAAEDWENLQAAHRICNARKGNKENFKIRAGQDQRQTVKKIILDGKW